MSILETNKIDIIAARPGSPVVKLVITDHLDWSDFDLHARMIQEKINTYLAFIESGQLAELATPRIPDLPEIHIELVLQHSPSKEADGLLAQVQGFLSGVAVVFDVTVKSPA